MWGRKVSKLLYLSLFLLISGQTLVAQFEISSTIRPRFEFRDGYKTLRSTESSPAAFTSQRTRLRLSYQNDFLSTAITAFDYRVWGDQVWKVDDATLGIHEAWAAIRLNPVMSLQFGRQELSYDNSRLISAVNWNQVGAAHDAAMFRYKKQGFQLDLVSAWNQSKEKTFGTDYWFDGADGRRLFYKNLTILWINKDFKNLSVSSLTVMDGFEQPTHPDKMNYRYTTGLILKLKTGNLNLALRPFYQGGTQHTGQKVNAWYVHANLSYRLNNKISTTLGLEAMSGNKAFGADSQKSHAFDILYGARHKFYGHMDYFNVPSSTNFGGLINPFAKLTWSFQNENNLTTEYHLFYLEQEIAITNPDLSGQKFLGQEIDFTFEKSINTYCQVCLGYSVMMGTDLLEQIKGGDKDLLNHWAYIMLNINPTLFRSDE